MFSFFTKKKAVSDNASKLCAYVWKSALSFSKAIGAPNSIGFDIYICTALLYSITDILQKAGVKDAVYSQFTVTTCSIFKINANNHNITWIRERQKEMIGALLTEGANLYTADGLRVVFDIAYLFGGDDNDDYDALLGPNALEQMEFRLAIQEVNIFAATLFKSTTT